MKRNLTPAEVLHIRKMWDTGKYTARAIAQAYGCNSETIARIGRRETYAWLEVEGSVPTATVGDLPIPVTKTPDEAAASLDRLLQELNKPEGEGK